MPGSTTITCSPSRTSVTVLCTNPPVEVSDPSSTTSTRAVRAFGSSTQSRLPRRSGDRDGFQRVDEHLQPRGVLRLELEQRSSYRPGREPDVPAAGLDAGLVGD